MALIVALIMLSFLGLLGGALLTSTTLNVWTSGNYRTGAQLLYLAEAGIEEARETLRNSARTPSQLLTEAAGADGILSSSRDPDLLLNGGDPAFLEGALTDIRIGRYHVFLRNDPADGVTNVSDANGALRLLSIGSVGDSRKIIEATVFKANFPRVPAALMLNGSPAIFQAPDSGPLSVRGLDYGAGGRHESAIGVISLADRAAVVAGIPVGSESQFPGRDNIAPPPADVRDVELELDARLKTAAGMERIVQKILENATEVYDPGWSGQARLTSVGGPTSSRVVVVNGDCVLGAGQGYGLLVVRGNLRVDANFWWEGVVLVIGQGSVTWINGASGQISGALFVARTREDDRGPANTLGTIRSGRGPVTADFRGAGQWTVGRNSSHIEAAYRSLPYTVAALQEY